MLRMITIYAKGYKYNNTNKLVITKCLKKLIAMKYFTKRLFYLKSLYKI